MRTTATRLQLYLDAETAILSGQQVRMGDRMLALPDLVEVRKAITDLQRQQARESAALAGRGSLGYSLVNLTGRCDR